MAQTVETLLRENIHGVFSEPDAEKRHKAISQDCGLKTACSSITTPGMKGIQVLRLAADGLAKKFPNFIFTERAKFRHFTESASSIGDSVPLERKPLSLASTCS